MELHVEVLQRCSCRATSDRRTARQHCLGWEKAVAKARQRFRARAKGTPGAKHCYCKKTRIGWVEVDLRLASGYEAALYGACGRSRSQDSAGRGLISMTCRRTNRYIENAANSARQTDSRYRRVSTNGRSDRRSMVAHRPMRPVIVTFLCFTPIAA